eukprot:gene5643-6225_t
MSSGSNYTVLTMVGAFALMACIIASLVYFDIVTIAGKCTDSGVTTPASPTQANANLLEMVSGTTGKVFKGEKKRSYSGPLRFSSLTAHQLNSLASHGNASFSQWVFPQGDHKCRYWSVVTTIFTPTSSVIKQSQLPAPWCMVIVADRKGPREYQIEGNSGKNFIYLTVEMQEKLVEASHMVKLLPWNHFGRKNIGFLYAIINKAEAIYDFDDDNLLVDPESLLLPGQERNGSSIRYNAVMHVRSVTKESTQSPRVLNPYPYFSPNISKGSLCWPRGYPINRIKDLDEETQMVDIPSRCVGVVQFLADRDPDVDAIYRLTESFPFWFSSSPPLVIPINTYTPYNAQTTVLMHSSFWSLLLPVTVHGRVSDIWRSYVAQHIFSRLKLFLVFAAPIVVHLRNDHDYMADFQSELPLYTQATALVKQLQENPCTAPTIPGCLEQTYVFLYEHGIVEMDDVVLVQAWIHDLIQAKYVFPSIRGEGNHSHPISSGDVGMKKLRGG